MEVHKRDDVPADESELNALDYSILRMQPKVLLGTPTRCIGMLSADAPPGEN